MTNPLTNEQFIEKSIKNQIEKFGYDKVVYKNNHTLVEIYCYKCERYFEQMPMNHLVGKGCKYCAKQKRADSHRNKQEDVIKRFKEKHGDKYDYSKVVYFRMDRKVIIICPIHKEFKQTPSNHLAYGCKRCGGTALKTQEEVIEQFKSVHGERYNYSLVEYKKNNIKVNIICRRHVMFQQTPRDHIAGQGCDLCGRITQGMKKRMTQDEFIKRAKEIHGNKYDYSKVVYQGNNVKVTIICNTKGHKPFRIRPVDHIHSYKSGCTSCAMYGYDQNKKGYLYISLIYTHNKEAIKIGKTNDPKGRNISINVSMKQGIAVRQYEYEGSGVEVHNNEKQLKQNYTIQLGYLTKKELPNGFSETLPYDMINEVEEYIINNFKNLKENDVKALDKETFLRKYKD